MITKLKDMKINRVSLVRRPAIRRQFVLRKSAEADDEIHELVKALHHHIEAVTELLGGDEDMKKKIEQVATMIEDGGDQAVSRLSGFLWQLRDLKTMLESTLTKDTNDEDKEEPGMEKGAVKEPVKDQTQNGTPAEAHVTKTEVEELLKSEREARMRAEERLAKMEEERKQERYLAKAASYKHLNIPVEDLARMIRTMDEANIDWATHFDRLEKEAQESKLIAVSGVDGEETRTVQEGESPFMAEVEKRVRERIVKGDTDKPEKIRVNVIETLQKENPGLYLEHIRIVRRRGRE
jgi:hypothetical protein